MLSIGVAPASFFAYDSSRRIENRRQDAGGTIVIEAFLWRGRVISFWWRGRKRRAWRGRCRYQLHARLGVRLRENRGRGLRRRERRRRWRERCRGRGRIREKRERGQKFCG